MTELGVNFKDACHRLWRVLIYDNHIFGGLNPVKCLRCREYTCTPTCIEERTSSKVALDIGGKMTWIVTGKFFSKLKLSLVILTTFEFSRQKVDLHFLKMALERILNLKMMDFGHFHMCKSSVLAKFGVLKCQL